MRDLVKTYRVAERDPARTSTPALIARLRAEHDVQDVRIERPAIEEVISRFYDLHGAGES